MKKEVELTSVISEEKKQLVGRSIYIPPPEKGFRMSKISNSKDLLHHRVLPLFFALYDMTFNIFKQ